MNAIDDLDVARGVRAYYTQRLAAGACCAPAGTAPVATAPVAMAPLAPGEEIPSFGCGDPTASAALATGETVLDLGSGAGLDAFRAAAAVGPTGRVLGVDMTPAMIERARSAASRLGLSHVEFREGMIEALPVADASVDVVLSNCVVNLSTDKARVFEEILRVLVPGGRMLVSDILVHAQHQEEPTIEDWCRCVAGAIDADAYARLARRAGLVDVNVAPGRPDLAPGETYAATVSARKADVRVATADDAAAAATLLADAGLPLAGWADAETRRWVLVEDGRVLGAIGVEFRGGEALARSLVVAPEARGRGFGGALLAVARREATLAGSARLYALTTTIADRLTALGFVETTRARLPAALQGSAELQGACPDSARAFELALGSRRRASSAPDVGAPATGSASLG